MNRNFLWIGLLMVSLIGMPKNSGLAQRRRAPFPDSAHTSEPIPPTGPSRSLKLMKESFEQTQKDTAQLYALATELKREVEKANEDVLSLTVMKQAEAIEKLAEKIKNRMKNL